MRILAETPTHSCGLIEPDEFSLFDQMRRMCWYDKSAEGAADADEIVSEMEDADNFWRREFEDESLAHFVLIEKGEESDSIIGMTGLAFPGPARNLPHIEFCDSHILRPHRGRRLSRLLYDARYAYLRSQGVSGQLQMRALDSNSPSIGAAMSNGFRLTERKLWCGPLRYRLLTRDFAANAPVAQALPLEFVA